MSKSDIEILVREIETIRDENVILKKKNEELEDKVSYLTKMKNIAFKMANIIRFTSNSRNDKLAMNSRELRDEFEAIREERRKSFESK